MATRTRRDYLACPRCGLRYEKNRRNGWPDTPDPRLYVFVCGVESGGCGAETDADQWLRFRGEPGLAGTRP